MIDVEQRAVVDVEVRADCRMYARGPPAALAAFHVSSAHLIHICGGATEVGEVAMEIRHASDSFHFAQDARFTSAHDKFSLVRRNSAERTATETATVEVDREADHLECRDSFVTVFGVRKAGVWQVETAVDLCSCHGRIWRIGDCIPSVGHLLQNAPWGEAVAFFLNMAEIGSVLFGVSDGLGVRMENDVVGTDASVDVCLSFE